MQQETDLEGQQTATNSSAYSSLTNSSGELNCNEAAHNETKMPSSPGGPKMVSSPSKMSQEIRCIIDDYSATLNKATKEIKTLTKAKASLEQAYEELLATNESLVKDLMAEIQHKKMIEAERDRVIAANEELFNETQRLSDTEAQWAEEKAALETELENVTSELENLRAEICDVEAMEMEASERTAKMVSILKLGKASLAATVTQLEIENKRLLRELQMAEEERDAILSRKELVSGENLQLIVEAENYRMAKTDLVAQLRTMQDKCKELERENSYLRTSKNETSCARNLPVIREDEKAQPDLLGQLTSMQEKCRQLERENTYLSTNSKEVTFPRPRPIVTPQSYPTVKSGMVRQLKSVQEKYRELERENMYLSNNISDRSERSDRFDRFDRFDGFDREKLFSMC